MCVNVSDLSDSHLILEAFDTFCGFEHDKRSMQAWIDILRKLKHADPPNGNLKKIVEEGMRKADDAEATRFERHAVQLITASRPRLHGWMDMIAAAIILRCVYTNPYFKKDVERVLDLHCDNEASKTKWKNVSKLLDDEDGVQEMALTTFLEMAAKGEGRKALYALRAVAYPPGVLTKEAAEAAEARTFLLDKKLDAEF